MKKVSEFLKGDLDLDFVSEKEFYKEAKKAVEMLSNYINSIDNRVLKGEEIDGFYLKSGRKIRYITEDGFKYLEKLLGEENVYTIIKKPIGITDLERLVSSSDMLEITKLNYIDVKVGNPTVALEE